MLRYCRRLTAFLTCLLIATLLCAATVVAQETEDSQLFLSGFNAYQQKEYPAAVARLGEVLKKYPETPLRDMTLFWLARAHYKVGNRSDAARYMAQFTREYPDNPLKNTVEDELLALAAQHEKGQGSAVQVAAAAQLEAEQQRAAEAAAQVAREKAEADRLAAERVAQEKAAREAAEKARILKAKAEADRIAREKAEAERLAAIKLEQEKQQAVAEAERIAREKAEADRLAAARQEAERLAQETAAREAAEKARILKAKADADRIAREKAEADRLAAVKAEEERRAREQAAAEQLAAQKAAEERRAAEKAAIAAAEQNERELAAARKAEEAKLAADRLRQERLGLKEKAIAEYKGILERFPNTPAARTAATRLKELGVAVVVPPAAAPAQPVESTATAQVLTLEVAQYAAFEFEVQPPQTPVEVARKNMIPFEIQNRGNGQDSFYLASSFPAEFGARFAAAATPEQSINQTPQLAPGEKFKGLLLLSVPAASIDGLRIAHPVKAASQFMPEASQSRTVSLTAAAPLLRAVVKTDKPQLLPGETVQYRITVLNVGSTPAEDVTLRLSFPPQYQAVDFAAAGFRQEMGAALVLDGLALKSGESRELVATFQLKGEALAKEELIVRADLLNNPLQTRGTFLSNATFVLPVSELALKMATERVKAVPGQVVTIPVRLVNKGNQRERFSLVAGSAPFQKVIVYHDLNRDGLRQPGESEVTTIGPLGPKEEAALLLEVTTSKTAQDGTLEKVSLSAAPESLQGKSVMVEAEVGYSRPVLQLAMKGREGRMVPGDLLTIDLDVLNRGSNLAKQVELEVTWPEQIELVAADQAAGKTGAGASLWRFSELGAGEKRVVKASFRIKSGTGVGTGVQLKSILTYQDQVGNRY
ncbi:outer membrane protein assembly factor BamD [Trichlorobacter lovleyi]|uniref:Conserved repeat domain protein n=1 Tax=Trichlorobacter lovleyi (strain ATCC BAA-1151 / DSM 17278 / SZ) TaxID=398767 RepID=B3E396_TRIL1|nr:outer membrane protein assembly factor BamD [Trichlorobacter lovleyi]ACD94308.1 conserved repeat domain protein [Trichlorobacter lovleyi SZ]